MYITRSNWNIKPPLGSRINPSHELAQGLVGCWLMNEGGGLRVQDSLNKNNGLINASTMTWVPGGINFTENATGYIQCKNGDIIGGLSNFTVISSATTLAPLDVNYPGVAGTIGGGGNVLYCERASSGNDILKLDLICLSSGKVQVEFAYRDDAGTLLQIRSATNIGFNNGQVFQYFLTKNGSSHNVGWNGRFDGTSSYGGTTAFTNANKSTIGNDVGDTASSWVGKVFYVYLWNRALSQSEIKSLYVNPYQFIQPIRRVFYSIPSAAPTTSGIQYSTAVCQAWMN